MIITPNCEYLLTLCQDHNLKQWSIAEQKLAFDYGIIGSGSNQSMCISRCGNYLFTTGTETYMKQWDINEQKLHKEYHDIIGERPTATTISQKENF